MFKKNIFIKSLPPGPNFMQNWLELSDSNLMWIICFCIQIKHSKNCETVSVKFINFKPHFDWINEFREKAVSH